MKRSLLVEGKGIPLGGVLAPANRHDSPLLAPTLDKLDVTSARSRMTSPSTSTRAMTRSSRRGRRGR